MLCYAGGGGRLPVGGAGDVEEEPAAGDRGAALRERRDGQGPLREWQGGGRQGTRRGRGSPPQHRWCQCHAIPGLHSKHNHHGKGRSLFVSLQFD